VCVCVCVCLCVCVCECVCVCVCACVFLREELMQKVTCVRCSPKNMQDVIAHGLWKNFFCPFSPTLSSSYTVLLINEVSVPNSRRPETLALLVNVLISQITSTTTFLRNLENGVFVGEILFQENFPCACTMILGEFRCHKRLFASGQKCGNTQMQGSQGPSQDCTCKEF